MREVHTSFLQLVQGGQFHTGDVGDDGLGEAQKLGLDGVGGDVRRHTHDNQCGIVIGGCGATRTEIDGQTNAGGRGIGENDVDALRTQRESNAAAEEAGADNANLTGQARGQRSACGRCGR